MGKIAARFRVALAGKGLLLLGLALLFLVLVLKGAFGPGQTMLVRLLSLGFAMPGWFSLRTALLAFADAAHGEAIEVRGAIALRSRAAGHSLRLPDGQFAEFILFNPWETLVADRPYRVLIGRRSRVLVARPEEEAFARTAA